MRATAMRVVRTVSVIVICCLINAAVIYWLGPFIWPHAQLEQPKQSVHFSDPEDL